MLLQTSSIVNDVSRLHMNSYHAPILTGDCNIPGNSTILYDILLVGIYK
jgi:hypothetical protein